MKKIRTQKDAFKAFLAPEKYEINENEACVFCQLKHARGISCCESCTPYCSVDPACSVIEFRDEEKLVRYVLRYCKDWRLKNIQRLVIKKVKAMGYEPCI